MENMRQCDSDVDNFSVSGPSPHVEQCSGLNPEASPFCISDQSPGADYLRSATKSETSVGPETIEADHISIPEVFTPNESFDSDSSVYAKGKLECCEQCHISLTAAAVESMTMMRCGKCKIFICGQCYQISRHFFKCKKRVYRYEIEL